MKYRALITLDWGRPHNDNARQTLYAALLDAGWYLAETSAFTMETDDINQIWRGIGLVAKGSAAAGTLTAFSFNFIGSDDFSKSRVLRAKKNFPRALDKIEKLPFPK